MSTVFIAKDETLGREVALKILSEEYSHDEKRIAAFEKEALLAASFSHPNLVSVYKTGRAFGRLYIAMEFVHGGHFEEYIEQIGQISEASVLPLAIQVAEVLKSAQSAGLIHRDVKPGNILIDTDGNAKLADFGLALVTKDGKAKAEEIWASTYYIPPETLDGKAEDFRADMYAFGATFYHALAGRPPCEEESTAANILPEAKRNILPLKLAAPGLREETYAVIDKAMAYHPHNRFENYDDMLVSLRTALMVVDGEISRTADQKSRLHQFILRFLSGKFLIISTLSLCFIGAAFFLRSYKYKVFLAKHPAREITSIEIPSMDKTDTTALIAADYLRATTALQNGEIQTASNIFSQLFENPDIQEPSKTLVGLHSIVTQLILGDISQANEQVEKLRSYRNSPTTSGELGNHIVLGKVLADFARAGFFYTDMLRLGLDSDGRNIAVLIAALKNWEAGALKEAKPLFEFYLAKASVTEDVIFIWYKQQVTSYLHDIELLHSKPFLEGPSSETECETLIAELDSISKQLKTSGQAPAILNKRRQELSLLAQNFFVPEVQKPKPKEDLRPKMNALGDTYRFEELAQLMEKAEEGIEGFDRDSLIAICYSSDHFLRNLEDDLSKSSVSLSFQLRDASSISMIGFKDTKLIGKRADGEFQEIKWQDFTPKQLIKLYRAILKNTQLSDDKEKWQRHEAAIAFDWLVGDRKRAISAASRLSEESEEFSKRWETMMKGMPNP